MSDNNRFIALEERHVHSTEKLIQQPALEERSVPEARLTIARYIPLLRSF